MKKKVYILAFVFFLIDLISKLVVLSISISMPLRVINKFFYIDRVTNTGAAFSILSGNSILFILIAIAVLIYIDKYVIPDVKHYFSISLVIGGIAGNLFDRVVYGKVIDFLSFRFGSYSFPIFNLADVFICVGAFLLIIQYIRGDLSGNKGTSK